MSARAPAGASAAPASAGRERFRTVKKFQVVLLCVLAACSYGVVHDQITARICLEYFTVAHPPFFPTSSPTLLALCWGVAATVGLGLVFGLVLALVSQSGGPPAIPPSHLVRPILILLTVMGSCALLTALLGYHLSQRHLIFLPSSLARATPVRLHDRFLAVWGAHLASYLVGLTGAAFVCFRIWRARGRPAVLSLYPRTGKQAARATLLAGITIFAVWHRFGK